MLLRPDINQDKRSNILLSAQEDCHAETNNFAENLNIATAYVLKILYKNKYHKSFRMATFTEGWYFVNASKIYEMMTHI